MEPQFPSRTADEISVQPNKRANSDYDLNGQVVWMQTLNSIHKTDANTEANISTSREMRRYRKGSEDYEAIVFDASEMTPEQAIDFIVSHEYLTGKWHYAASEKYPEPVIDAQRSNEEPEEFAKRVLDHDDALPKIAKQREDYITSQRNKFDKQVKDWTLKTRNERIIQAYVEKVRTIKSNQREVLEVLLRAVRKADDHRRRYFESAEEIADLDDDIREALVAKYRDLDSVRFEEIPTSPVG